MRRGCGIGRRARRVLACLVLAAGLAARTPPATGHDCDGPKAWLADEIWLTCPGEGPHGDAGGQAPPERAAGAWLLPVHEWAE